MQEKQNNWQRIEAVIRWANMSINYFARYIGLAQGENLYQIKRGNNGISRDVANRIVACFPQIDKLWLLTGEGSMFADGELRGAQIPFYDADVEKSLKEVSKLDPHSYLVVPPVGMCDFAMRYSDASTDETTVTESIVLLKAIGNEEIVAGGRYVIVTRKSVTLHTVRAIELSGALRLAADGINEKSDFLLASSEIEVAYKVKGKITINA